MYSISHQAYLIFLKRAINNPRVKNNVTLVDHKRGNSYFCSQQGISYLKCDGFMGGLCRFKQGSENLIKIHQQHRIKLGGYFLECYEGKLSEMYGEQGFKTVVKLKFNPQFAPDGWEYDKDLKVQPNVVFMSLYEVPTVWTDDYKTAYTYASISKNISTSKG